MPITSDVFSWYIEAWNDMRCYANRAKFNCINEWFDGCFNDTGNVGDRRILLLSGPTGCGKTFSINFIARKKGFVLNDALNCQLQMKRNYKCLIMEQELNKGGIQETSRFIDLYDNFCPSLSNQKMKNEILYSKNPIIIIVTNPVSLEPSINVWLKDLVNCKRVCHIEYPFQLISLSNILGFCHSPEL